MSGFPGSITERLPIRHGAIVGASAWVFGIVVSYALALVAGVSGSDMGISVLDLSIVFYSTLHLWPVVLAPGTETATAALTFTPIAVAILLGAGYRVASVADGERGFENGATVTVGYAVLAVLSLLFVLGSPTEFFFQQATGWTVVVVVFTGLVMPVVFGGLGGLVAHWRSN